MKKLETSTEFTYRFETEKMNFATRKRKELEDFSFLSKRELEEMKSKQNKWANISPESTGARSKQNESAHIATMAESAKGLLCSNLEACRTCLRQNLSCRGFIQ